jgi:hypothetical protein
MNSTTDQQIWDDYYMNKSAGNWYPDEAEKDLNDWAETVVSVLHAAAILIATIVLGAIVWIAKA